MKGKGVEREFMEEAIEKASNLIHILTNENQLLKIQNVKIQQMMMELQKKNEEAIHANIRLAEEKDQYIMKLKSLENKIQTMKEYTEKLEESMQQKGKKNKQLHEKICEEKGKSKEMEKQAEKENRRNLSLQNQNQYLIKIIQNLEQKQSTALSECCDSKQRLKKELVMVERTKQAFSRRCEQFKLQNQKLKQSIVSLQVKNKELVMKIGSLKQKQGKAESYESKLELAEKSLGDLIQSSLKTKAEQSLQQKVDQVKNYICYRLQHIENLYKLLTDWTKKIDPSLIKSQKKDLKQMGWLANRLGTYLNELTK